MAERAAKRCRAVAIVKETEGYRLMRLSMRLQSYDDEVIPQVLTPRTGSDMAKKEFEDSFYLWKIYIRQFEHRVTVFHA